MTAAPRHRRTAPPPHRAIDAGADRHRRAAPAARSPRSACRASRARRRRRRSASATGRSPPGCRSSPRSRRATSRKPGLDVEALKFAGAQQVMEAMLVGPLATAAPTAPARPTSRSARSRSRASSRSSRPTRATRSTCSTNSSCRRTARSRRSPSCKGKRVASGPGIQNVTLAKTDARARGRRRASASSSCRSASTSPRSPPARSTPCYTLEPTGTVGRLNGTTRVLEAGVVAKLHPRRSAGAVARRLGEPDDRVHQEVSGRGEEVHRRVLQGHRARAHQARRGAPVHEGLHRDRGPADERGAAGLVHAVQRVQARATSPTSRSSTTCSPTRASSRSASMVEPMLYKG